MVVNTPSDSYTSFQTAIVPEDSPQSSDDGSAMHSPVFAQANYSTYTDNFRYSQDHLVVHPSTRMITPQYDYGHSLSAQQPPMLNTSLELPNSSARLPFSPLYSIQSRTHSDFHPHSPVGSHHITPRHSHLEFRYSSPSSERRLSGGPAHHQSYAHPTEERSSAMSTDHRPSTTTHTTDSNSSTPSASSSKPMRKEVSNVVIACRQCHSRKIRCDSTRPVCNNCVRRSNDCEYDKKPRRRGPDKRPGTRQRSCKNRPADGSAPPPKRKKLTPTELEPGEEQQATNPSDPSQSSPDSRSLDRYSPKFYPPELYPAVYHPSASGTDLRISPHPRSELAPAQRRLSSYVYDQDSRSHGVPAVHSLEREQKLWWDTILKAYPLNFIFDELSFIVHTTSSTLLFINLDYVMERLYSDKRHHIQPAFIYAVLALAKLLRSSKLETDSTGLSHAVDFVHHAYAAYKDVIDCHWWIPH